MHPLKTLAITKLILDCRKLRNSYFYRVHQCALAAGQPVHRKHAHMHTRNNGDIDTDLAMDLDTNFTWTPPLQARVRLTTSWRGLKAQQGMRLQLPLTGLSNALQNSHQLLIPSWKGTRSWRERCMTLQSRNRLTKELSLRRCGRRRCPAGGN
ncbi:hypothetical protein BDR07DRAFT_643506 [Suillus spraguei]|nr:hypothetical protein BDR07DRAFT_643506 [Suillus spraguei]